ncbi:MAG: AsmA family protein, partial [Pseudomonadota bacterium]
VSFESADARVKFMPLLGKRVEVGKLSLNGLKVNLIRNEQGVDNWSTLAGDGEAAPAPETPAADGGAAFETGKIGGIEVSDATISFEDREAGMTATLANLGASTGPIGSLNDAVSIKAGFDLAISEPAVAVRIDLTGDGRNDNGTLRLVDPELRVSGGRQELSPDLSIDEFLLEITAPALAASAEKVDMPSPSITLSAKGGSLDALTLDVGAESLSFDVTGDKLVLPAPSVKLDVSGDVVPAPVDLSVSADSLTVSPTAETLSLSNYTVDAMGVNAAGSLQAVKWSSSLRASGPIKVAPFSARDVMSRLDIPLETTDPKAMSKVALDGQIDVRGDAASLNDLVVTLDETRMTGRAGLSSIEKGALDFDLKIDAIVADGYLAPAAEGQADTGSAADAIVLPAETIRGVNAKGKLAIGALTFSGIESTDIEIGVNAGGGNVRVFPSRAKLYGGTYSGDIRIDASGSRPKLSLNETVNGIDFNKFAAAVMPGAPVHGTLTGNVLMSATGETTAALKSTLNGTTEFDFANGYVDGIDLWNVVQGIVAVANKSVPSVSERPWRTPFEQLKGKARVVDGVVSVETMAASVPHLDVTGGGSVNLNTSALDLSVNAEIVEEEGEELLPRERSLIGFRVPVVIGGTIEAPKPDTAKSAVAVVAQLAKRKLAGQLGLTDGEGGSSRQDIDNAVDQKKEELKDEIDNKVKDALGGLFGRGKDKDKD